MLLCIKLHLLIVRKIKTLSSLKIFNAANPNNFKFLYILFNGFSTFDSIKEILALHNRDDNGA